MTTEVLARILQAKPLPQLFDSKDEVVLPKIINKLLLCKTDISLFYLNKLIISQDKKNKRLPLEN